MKTKWKDCVFVDLRLRSEQKKEEPTTSREPAATTKIKMGLLWIALAYILSSSIFMINLMNCCVDAQQQTHHDFHMKRKWSTEKKILPKRTYLAYKNR